MNYSMDISDAMTFAAKTMADDIDKACLWSICIIPDKSKWQECSRFTQYDWNIISLHGGLTDEFVKEFVLQLNLTNVLSNSKELSEDTVKYVKLLKEMGGNKNE